VIKINFSETSRNKIYCNYYIFNPYKNGVTVLVCSVQMNGDSVHPVSWWPFSTDVRLQSHCPSCDTLAPHRVPSGHCGLPVTILGMPPTQLPPSTSSSGADTTDLQYSASRCQFTFTQVNNWSTTSTQKTKLIYFTSFEKIKNFHYSVNAKSTPEPSSSIWIQSTS
jgi:hypothetical protein